MLSHLILSTTYLEPISWNIKQKGKLKYRVKPFTAYRVNSFAHLLLILIKQLL